MYGAIGRRFGGALTGAATIALTLATAAGATTTKTPAPAAHGAISLIGAFTVSHQSVTVSGRSVQFRGVVRPYATGQHTTIRVYLGHKLLKVERLRIKRSRGGTYGYFSDHVVSPGVGTVTVLALHNKTAKLGAFRIWKGFAALSAAVGPGSTGRFVQLLQQRLAALHFYIPQTGVFDSGTEWALDAYHRLLTWGTSMSLDGRTVAWLLNGWGEFKVRYPRDGKHAEGNLGNQLLALIDRGKVQAIYPISSGKPSTPTILGRFHVYRKQPGYLPDGMYYSNFFTGGYAIHGYNPAPDYPASHGCMRVPIQDAISIYNWIRIGDGVDTYY
jgi:L,D-transpeptidase-like protein/putative peptidoglycan binding protein